MITRPSLRLRLTLVFTLTMALILGVGGYVFYLRLASTTLETIDQGIDARLLHLAALARAGNVRVAGAGESDALAQVLTANGRVIARSPDSPSHSLLPPTLRHRALRHAEVFDQDIVSGVRPTGTWRIHARSAAAPTGRVIVVAGASLDARNHTLSQLRLQLLIGGPILVALASFASYGLAAAALRPVERMRATAAVISGERSGERLPVPPGEDEIVRLGRTLNAMLERLEESRLREQRFIADASHELRTPLTLLKAELEIALRRSRTVDELESALRATAAETDRLVQLTEDLLLIARADQGNLALRVTHLPAAGIFGAVARRFQLRADASHREITVDCPPDLIVAGDKLRLEQAVSNLVDNALRHGAGTIRLTAIETVDDTQLHVLDEGDGLPADFVDTAFDRFTQADSAHTDCGAGLGLAIVASIAQAHEGSAHASPRLGTKPADVWLALPRAHLTTRSGGATHVPRGARTDSEARR